MYLSLHYDIFVLSLLNVLSCMYVLAYAHTCVSVCVFTPPHPPGLCCGEEANMLAYRGGVYFGKKFLQNLENGYTT